MPSEDDDCARPSAPDPIGCAVLITIIVGGYLGLFVFGALFSAACWLAGHEPTHEQRLISAAVSALLGILCGACLFALLASRSRRRTRAGTGSPWRVFFQWFEAWMGAIWGVFVAFYCSFYVFVAPVEYLLMETNDVAYVFISLLIFIVTQGPFLWFVGSAMGTGPMPMGVTAALRQPRIWTIVQPLVWAWWLGHYLGGLAIAQHLLREGFDSASGKIIGVLGLLGVSYAGNVYLMLSLATWSPRRELLEKVWRKRLWINLAVVVIGGALANELLG